MNGQELDRCVDPCSHCQQPIAHSSVHYQIDYDVRRLRGNHVVVEHAETIATLCARCSLLFDLTRLDIPSRDGWYSFEPLGYAPIDDCRCALCQTKFREGDTFEAGLITPVNFGREQEGPTLTISLCQSCAAKRSLRDAEPPSNACPPYCYQCGMYTGYRGGMADRRECYLAHPSIKDSAWQGETVRICQTCFFEEPHGERVSSEPGAPGPHQ